VLGPCNGLSPTVSIYDGAFLLHPALKILDIPRGFVVFLVGGIGRLSQSAEGRLSPAAISRLDIRERLGYLVLAVPVPWNGLWWVCNSPFFFLLQYDRIRIYCLREATDDHGLEGDYVYAH
jgi:hypothetical protein